MTLPHRKHTYSVQTQTIIQWLVRKASGKSGICIDSAEIFIGLRRGVWIGRAYSTWFNWRWAIDVGWYWCRGVQVSGRGDQGSCSGTSVRLILRFKRVWSAAVTVAGGNNLSLDVRNGCETFLLEGRWWVGLGEVCGVWLSVVGCSAVRWSAVEWGEVEWGEVEWGVDVLNIHNDENRWKWYNLIFIYSFDIQFNSI